MPLLTAQGLTKYYGAQRVFADLSLSIAHDDRIALVGPNGCGKTTLLRLLLGLDEPSAGTVSRARGLRMGYLPQQPHLDTTQTLHGEMLAVFAEIRQHQDEVMELAQGLADAPDPEEALARYAEAERRFELAGGYEYENRIDRVLTGLGFSRAMYDWPIAVLSGGQVTRALLARLLLQEPELLLLDEPTNYLDLDALEWLESYLQEWPRGLLVVSHDRYFLDKVVTRVFELNHGELSNYRGNYSRYAAQRQERRERQEREFEAQQQEIGRTEEFVRRYGAGQRSREAKGREKRLERLERIAAPVHDRTMSLRLGSPLRSGDHVLICEDGVTIGYASKPHATAGAGEEHVLFRTGPFIVQRGQHVALLGPNGSGKTTFVRTMLREVKPLEGRIRTGASVKVGYLPQSQSWLDPNRTVLEQITAASGLLIDEARHVLARFLFTGDDVFKLTGSLSGGELSRLGLAILTLRGANLLILDEPTTHLDVASQEVLQGVLSGFAGTLLFVSHDRYLIDALATHVWEIRDGAMTQFAGNYTAYAAQRQREAARATAASRGLTAREEQRRELRQRQRDLRRRDERLAAVEAEIERLEREIAETARLLQDATASQDARAIQSLGLAYEDLQQSLAAEIAEWEKLASPLEDPACTLSG